MATVQHSLSPANHYDADSYADFLAARAAGSEPPDDDPIAFGEWLDAPLRPCDVPDTYPDEAPTDESFDDADADWVASCSAAADAMIPYEVAEFLARTRVGGHDAAEGGAP